MPGFDNFYAILSICKYIIIYVWVVYIHVYFILKPDEVKHFNINRFTIMITSLSD